MRGFVFDNKLSFIIILCVLTNEKSYFEVEVFCKYNNFSNLIRLETFYKLGYESSDDCAETLHLYFEVR